MIRKNIIANLALDLPEATPHQQNDLEIMLLAGGPSLDEFEDEIIRKRSEGMLLVTTNGSYNWCLERGLKPSAQIVVDAREFNKRFVIPHSAGCRYLLASQCHPETVRAAPLEQVVLWHAGSASAVKESVEYFDKLNRRARQYFPIMGGSTVMLRAIPLMVMLGYRKFHIYGFDSCVMEGRHHAYVQEENDRKFLMDVTVGNRTFKCHAWMLVQAQQFIDMQKMIAPVVEMAVYGDGLIANIIQTGAQKAQESLYGSLSLQYLQQCKALPDGWNH